MFYQVEKNLTERYKNAYGFLNRSESLFLSFPTKEKNYIGYLDTDFMIGLVVRFDLRLSGHFMAEC